MSPPKSGSLLPFAVLAFALGAGCIGELRELPRSDAAAAPDGGRDLAPRSPDLEATPVRFAPTIQGDLDRLGCSSNACHGGAAPMRVVAMPGLDDLVANYHEVLARTVGGAGAALLQKNLQGSPLGHAGGQRFASTSDPNYQRWLAWVNAGAPSGIAAASEDAGVDAAAGDGGS